MVTVDRLVNTLGVYGTRLYGCPAARDRELRSVAVHDTSSAAPVVGEVFLAVGVTSLAEAVALGAGARAVLTIARTTETPGRELLDALAESESAVLLADPSVPWSQLAVMVYGLVLEGRETESGRGPSDLPALADTIAAALDAAITIEDRSSHVLAYSTAQHYTDPARQDTIVGRRKPDHIREFLDRAGAFEHLARSDAPLYIPPALEFGLHGRTAIAIRAGRELLGSVWVSAADPLDASRTQLLDNGAHTVALHMVRARVSADLERHIESELVIGWIEGSPDADAIAGKLGMPTRNVRVIAVQTPSDHEPDPGILLAFERATAGFGWSRPGRSALLGNTVYTVLPAGDDPEPALRWLRDLTAGLPPHLRIHAGIGGPADARTVPASRHEADESAALHASADTPEPICYDRSWDRILVHRLKSAATVGRLPSYGPVPQLIRHDAEHNTHYTATLTTWLQTHSDLTATAEELKVHPNTVRRRLEKITQITDLRLDDPRQQLAALIALTAWPHPDNTSRPA